MNYETIKVKGSYCTGDWLLSATAGLESPVCGWSSAFNNGLSFVCCRRIRLSTAVSRLRSRVNRLACLTSS